MNIFTNNDLLGYIFFDIDSLTYYKTKKTNVLSDIIGFTNNNVFENINESPYIDFKQNLDIDELNKIKDYVINNNGKDITEKLNDTDMKIKYSSGLNNNNNNQKK